MQVNMKSKQCIAWIVLTAFVAGWFWDALGAWTGPILGVWFAGTQKIRSAFLWLLAFTFIPIAIHHWRVLPGNYGANAGLILLGSVLMVLPFLAHRLLSERLYGVIWTLPFPLARLAVVWLMAEFIARGNWGKDYLVSQFFAPQALTAPMALRLFSISWFAAAIVWLWDRNFHFSGAFRVFPSRSGPWTSRTETVALLRSPVTRTMVRAVGRGRREHLESSAGEIFPILDKMPVFQRPEDLNGQNRKYNRLYETIGGFYDDSQRVLCALAGMDRDAYVMSYMGLLEVKPGDRVLETSVGTGLNFKYLPRGIRRFGLDLSHEMLMRCQSNLRRWNMQADLVLGNAEALPFADERFDVVFHVGGINFFSDRAAAIREMIRVAKPGSLLLIADETEEHVKEAYETIPYTREFFKGRESAVAAPIDLIPDAMEEVQVKIIRISGKNRFYALTFRKPVAQDPELNGAAVTTSEPFYR